MADDKQVDFNKDNSKKATFLESLSDEALYHRYIVKGDILKWMDECTELLNQNNPDTTPVYGCCVSLVGQMLNDIVSLFFLKSQTQLKDTGYTLNAKQIISDLEALYKENKKEVLQSQINGKLTPYMRHATKYILSLCLDSLLYMTEKNQQTKP